MRITYHESAAVLLATIDQVDLLYSGIRALCLFWDKNLSFKRKALFVKSLGQQKWILLIFVAK